MLYGPVPFVDRTADLSAACFVSQSESRIAFVENAILLRNATSGEQRSNSTVSRSTALIWLNSPVYPAGGLAQSTAVAGYDCPSYGASDGACDGWVDGACEAGADVAAPPQ